MDRLVTKVEGSTPRLKEVEVLKVKVALALAAANPRIGA